MMVIADDGYIRYIDIAIAEPSGASYLVTGSADGVRVAAKCREKNKINHFKAYAPGVDPSLFVPFVFESSGRPGKCALDFLKHTGMLGGIVRSLKEQISVSVARYGGKMIADLKRGPLGG